MSETATKKEQKKATCENTENKQKYSSMSTIDKYISPVDYSRIHCPRLFICHPTVHKVFYHFSPRAFFVEPENADSPEVFVPYNA